MNKLTNSQLSDFIKAKVLKEKCEQLFDEMKREVNAEFAHDYEETHNKGRDVIAPSGVIASISYVPSKQDAALIIDDKEAFNEWAIENCYVLPDTKACLAHYLSTGEIPDGCTIGTKPKAGYVSVRNVSDEYKDRIGQRFAGLFGDRMGEK